MRSVECARKNACGTRKDASRETSGAADNVSAYQLVKSSENHPLTGGYDNLR